MEPKLPMPHLGPEKSPDSYNRSVESYSMPQPEQRNEREIPTIERLDTARQETLQVPVLPPPVVSPVSAPVPTANDTLHPTPVADTPLIANDDDLIEKEWVDKAKQIIADTRDDPYRRELEVGRLQADYLKKRYGKELGASQ
jgi:hypothetical protein